MKEEKYISAIRQLKEHVKLTQQQAVLTVNVRLLFLYWEIGQFVISEKKKQGWGAKIVSRVSKELTTEFPEMKGFSARNLKYMVTFAEKHPPNNLRSNRSPIMQAVPAQLETPPVLLENSIHLYDFSNHPISKITWSHHLILLDKVQDKKALYYYINRTINEGWSYRVLKHKVEQKLFESQGSLPNNFDKTLPEKQSELAKQTLKSEYIFDFLNISHASKERELELALLVQIKDFLLELGSGFGFMGQQFHIEIGAQDFYLDLLFFNIPLNCYFIIELKIDDFKPEYAGKMNFYLNAADDLLKQKHHQPTVGLLLCKTTNTIIAEYSLRDNNKPIGIANYKLLPTKEDFVELLKKNQIFNSPK